MIIWSLVIWKSTRWKKDDHSEYREEQYELVGEHFRNVYKLGQRVRVRVLGADRLQRTIDFEFCEENE